MLDVSKIVADSDLFKVDESCIKAGIGQLLCADYSKCQLEGYVPSHSCENCRVSEFVDKLYEDRYELLDLLTVEGTSISQEPYEPTCKYGYSDCIFDPAYDEYYYDSTDDHPMCKGCIDGNCYDDEDK